MAVRLPPDQPDANTPRDRPHLPSDARKARRLGRVPIKLSFRSILKLFRSLTFFLLILFFLWLTLSYLDLPKGVHQGNNAFESLPIRGPSLYPRTYPSGTFGVGFVEDPVEQGITVDSGPFLSIQGIDSSTVKTVFSIRLARTRDGNFGGVVVFDYPKSLHAVGIAAGDTTYDPTSGVVKSGSGLEQREVFFDHHRPMVTRVFIPFAFPRDPAGLRQSSVTIGIATESTGSNKLFAVNERLGVWRFTVGWTTAILFDEYDDDIYPLNLSQTGSQAVSRVAIQLTNANHTFGVLNGQPTFTSFQIAEWNFPSSSRSYYLIRSGTYQNGRIRWVIDRADNLLILLLGVVLGILWGKRRVSS
jgi:hypothetical protein